MRIAVTGREDDMKRTLLITGLGIAVLLVAGLTLVFLWTRQPSSGGSPPASPVAGAEPQGAAPGAPPAAAAPLASPAPNSPLERARARKLALVREATSAPMADRVTRKAVRKALLRGAVQSRLARCADSHGGFGGGAAPGPAPRAAPAVLVLEMEAQDGGLRIAEVQVQSFGGASERAVSCAREVLRGKRIAAESAEPGSRLSMTLPLSPGSGDLASAR